MLQIGSLVDNKYKILSEVGHGGMSVVYLAINERANKTWAVKEVRKDGVCDFEAVKQGLIVETDMLKRLNHPHLPSIIDVIDTEDSFLIVMDYIEGKSLQSVLKKAGAQPQDLVIKWSIQLCDVLGYLHSRTPSIIYRDMKPANVMLKPTGDITLIDFGTAREFKNRSMVEDTTCLGTRGYAAPEQFGGRGQTDPRTDIYCLGATMYHLITGHSPAEPPYEIKPLSYWDASYFGTGLEQIINKCCQQDPEARYQSCAELMYDLEHVGDMDLVTQQKRKRKWSAFVASILVGVVGLGGMLGTTLLKNNAVANSYDYSVEQAEMYVGSDFDTVYRYTSDAVKVDPEREEAYDVLLTAVEDDGILEDAEFRKLKECFEGYAEGSTVPCVDQLLEENPEAYCDVNYRIGKLLALMGSGGDDSLERAAVYFKKALDKGGLRNTANNDLKEKELLASTFEKIGSSIKRLKANGSEEKYYVDSKNEYSHAQLWQDLLELQNKFPIDAMDAESYGIALYGRIAYLINSFADDFRADEVTYEQMQDLLAVLQSSLEEVKGREGVYKRYGKLIDQSMSNVSSVQSTLTVKMENEKGNKKDNTVITIPTEEQGGDEE